MNRRTFLTDRSGRWRSADLRGRPAGVRGSPGQSPAIITAAGAKPGIPFGVTAGDVGGGRAVVWSAPTTSTARMFVELSTNERFNGRAARARGPAAL